MAREKITSSVNTGVAYSRAATQYGRRVSESAAFGSDCEDYYMETTFRFNDLPKATLDKLINEIPVGTIITRAVLKVNEAFVGGTSIAVGNVLRNNTGGVSGAYITAAQGATANLTLGAIIVGTGAQINAANNTAGLVPLVAAVGTFTAGEATIRLYTETLYDHNQIRNG